MELSMSTKNLTVSVLIVSSMIGIDGWGIFILAMISYDIGLAKVELLFEELLHDGVLTYELLEDGIWDDGTRICEYGGSCNGWRYLD